MSIVAGTAFSKCQRLRSKSKSKSKLRSRTISSSHQLTTSGKAEKTQPTHIIHIQNPHPNTRRQIPFPRLITPSSPTFPSCSCTTSTRPRTGTGTGIRAFAESP